MKNLANDNEWLWDKNKFINRKYIMQEMYQNFMDGDDGEVSQVYFSFILFHFSIINLFKLGLRKVAK